MRCESIGRPSRLNLPAIPHMGAYLASCDPPRTRLELTEDNWADSGFILIELQRVTVHEGRPRDSEHLQDRWRDGSQRNLARMDTMAFPRPSDPQHAIRMV